ncbi:Mannose-specific PTS system transporter subunit IIC [Escherichia coli]|nr:Mannose-specific PTS system transporter subunit IIC [Escherichia coli]
MEITTLQIVLVFIVACIAGMGSILDEFQFHRPLIACTLVGIVLWRYENRYYYRWYAGNDRAGLDEHRCCSCA